MPPPADRAVARVTAHVRRVHRVFDHDALDPIRELYAEEVEGAVRALDRAVRERRGDQVDVVLHGALLGLATRDLLRIFGRVAGAIVVAGQDVLAAARSATTELFGELSGRSVAPYRPVTADRRDQVERNRLRTAAGLAAAADTRVRQALAAALLAELTAGQTAERVGEALATEWWRIERAVRTETAYAYNAGQVDAIRALAAEHRGLMKRWTELIDDRTGLGLDNAVAPDSFALHGQVAPPDGVFTMPNDPLAPQRMVGQSWDFPPNRPNDRAVVIPWMRGWGVPGWLYRDGGRAPVA